MKVSVVIPIYNGFEDTQECLESLFRFNPGTSVVIVDDASNDGSLSQLQASFPDIEGLRCEYNVGFGAASNAGLKKAFDGGADFALLVNNDTLFTEGLIDKLLETGRANPDAGLVAPLIRAYPSGEIWSAGGTARLEEGRADNLVEVQSDEPYETDWLTGCAYLMPREVFEKVGGFDERFFMYAEDLEFSLRVRAAGYRLIVEPRALFHHKVSRTSSMLSPAKHYYKIRNQLEVMSRRLDPAAFAQARSHMMRRAWVRLVKDTYRQGWQGVQRFFAVRHAMRDQREGRLGRKA